jgi:hypothetical protein
MVSSKPSPMNRRQQRPPQPTSQASAVFSTAPRVDPDLTEQLRGQQARSGFRPGIVRRSSVGIARIVVHVCATAVADVAAVNPQHDSKKRSIGRAHGSSLLLESR